MAPTICDVFSSIRNELGGEKDKDFIEQLACYIDSIEKKPTSVQMGVGATAGVCTGVLYTRGSSAVAVVLALGLVSFRYCNYRGYVQLSRSKIRMVKNAIKQELRDIKREVWDEECRLEWEFNKFVTSNFWLLTGFAGGFVLGFALTEQMSHNSLMLACAIVLMVYLRSLEIPVASIRSTLEAEKKAVENMPQNILAYFADPISKMPLKRTSKWIVVTSIQAPTEDVKRLASYPDWTLVVVGDSKTPANWSLPDVHYLSLERQVQLGFASVGKLPTRSYTRKNAGYLYAIANGAQWIYDTDDDNKPFGKGLQQFEFNTDRTRGLRFTRPQATYEYPATTIQNSLFNPYRHFGRPDIWPRGFPLEHIKNHDHLDGSYRLCRVQRPAAVQQGIVQKDPDVDAIYRLLHAEPDTGLDESFNDFAPPVILAPGTYAPWNSQNTMFSYSAFFGLFLPTTVAFRVTDIWRSYFTQALLHAAGETVSFVPVSAIQRRNAHNYLKDFDDELDVYDKSGAIVEFIDKWKCQEETMDKCTIELANQFAKRGFWGEADAELVVQWVADMQKIGYKFPTIRPGAISEYPIGDERDLRRNCRRVHIALGNDLPFYKSQPAEERAAAKILNFGELKAWCNASSSEKSKAWLFPTQSELAQVTTENTTLTDNYQNVAIITNNWPWGQGMGVLQRMYDANFGMLIFCGHFPKQSRAEANYPYLKTPINYIDLSNDEVHEGYLMYYCLAKVEEMKIQNVKGYVMFSDDMIYNFWNPLNPDKMHASKRRLGEWGPWWLDRKHGFNAMKKMVHLLEGKCKADAEVGEFVQELKREIEANKSIELKPNQYLMEGDGWANGDWMYIPASNISFVATFAELAHEGGLFHELFTSKLLHILPSEGLTDVEQARVISLWSDERHTWTRNYTDRLIGMHPIKLSELQKLPDRAAFCDVILDAFYHNIFRIKTTN